MPSFKTVLFLFTAGGVAFLNVLSKPTGTLRERRIRRAETNATNNVVVNDADNFCLIVPRDPNTAIGESEYPGGTTTYCSPSAKSSDAQGTIPMTFWKTVGFETGIKTGRYAQLTGCIDPSVLDRLDPDDAGGQYDSSGGTSGTGNPIGSVCTGYNHYIELIEPAGARACIRCCDDAEDCPTHQDRTGCPNAIPGNYFDCV